MKIKQKQFDALEKLKEVDWCSRKYINLTWWDCFSLQRKRLIESRKVTPNRFNSQSRKVYKITIEGKKVLFDVYSKLNNIEYMKAFYKR